MKLKKIQVKKLYKGCVSIRDYIIHRCISKEQNLQIRYKNWIMTLNLEQLKNYAQLHKQEFQSKYNHKSYQLYDFLFKPDSLIQCRKN